MVPLSRAASLSMVSRPSTCSPGSPRTCTHIDQSPRQQELLLDGQSKWLSTPSLVVESCGVDQTKRKRTQTAPALHARRSSTALATRAQGCVQHSRHGHAANHARRRLDTSSRKEHPLPQGSKLRLEPLTLRVRRRGVPGRERGARPVQRRQQQVAWTGRLRHCS